MKEKKVGSSKEPIRERIELLAEKESHNFWTLSTWTKMDIVYT